MGDSAAAFLGTSSLLQSANSLNSSMAQANALKAQGNYAKVTSDLNKSFADYKAQDALTRGENAIAAHGMAVKKLLGSQRTALAAQGIDLTSGSAADTLESTKYLSNLDVLTIKNNAAKEAFGYEVQGMNAELQGNFAQQAGYNAANNTLLTGGLNALGQGAAAGYYFSGGTLSPKKGSV